MSKEDFPNSDISRVYYSPSGERIMVWVDDKWGTYIREDAVADLIKEAIAANENLKIEPHE